MIQRQGHSLPASVTLDKAYLLYNVLLVRTLRLMGCVCYMPLCLCCRLCA